MVERIVTTEVPTRIARLALFRRQTSILPTPDATRSDAAGTDVTGCPGAAHAGIITLGGAVRMGHASHVGIVWAERLACLRFGLSIRGYVPCVAYCIDAL